ncbi:hypothetical protein SDC9_15020 [bioreactor metagenome]|uniref:Uncharacterized protein n=1 Tax=bioreactor metagenome TaxID=1076179 RepID=A0A644TQS0_9ZZZZ
MKLSNSICPMMSDSTDMVYCSKKECALFNRDFDIYDIQVIANQLTEIHSKSA